LLRNVTYRRLWTSILISSFGGPVTMLALPLTAAVLLHATAWKTEVQTAMELAPFVLLSLPAGVWLDRVRKLPVYVVGEGIIALVLASVSLAWYLGWLQLALASMGVWDVASFVFMLLCFSAGAVLIFINFLAPSGVAQCAGVADGALTCSVQFCHFQLWSLSCLTALPYRRSICFPNGC